jgi:hypothetical protein
VLSALLLVAPAAHAEEDAPPAVAPNAPWRIALRPPDLGRDVAPKASGLDLSALRERSSPAHTHPLRLSLDLSVAALRLAVHGDYKPGFAAFLGTSTASLGGLRLRF